MNTLKNTKVTVFKMTEGSVERQKWDDIAKGAKRAFREVLNTSAECRKRNGEECYVFGYCDSDVELSAVCVLKHGEAVFFLKEVAIGDAVSNFSAQ